MPKWYPALALGLALSGCSGYMPFSGGALEGTVQTSPEDWTQLAQAKIVQLETNPDDPYSVNVWVIGMGPALYVHAGANRATWVEHIETDPAVRVKIGESLYELNAVRVTSTEEFNRFSDDYETKYGNRPRNENVAQAYLFRLEPRN